MKTEPIIWEFTMLGSFPCVACEEKRAEFKAKVRHRSVDVNLNLCPDCVKLSEETLIKKVFKCFMPPLDTASLNTFVNSKRTYNPLF